MRVLENHQSESIVDAVQENIEFESIILSAKSTSYVNLSDHVEVHIQKKSDKEATTKLLSGFM